MYPDVLRLINRENLGYVFIMMPELIELLTQNDYGRILEYLQVWFKNHENDKPILKRLEIAVYQAAGKPDDEWFALLSDIKNTCPLSSEEINIDARIETILRKYPLLQSVGVGLASTFFSAVRLIIQGDFLKALDAFVSASQNMEISDEDMETCILFGINLSAAAGNSTTNIHFRKKWISYLLDNSRNEEALQELDVLEQILPGGVNSK
jgi:hypothetical protein